MTKSKKTVSVITFLILIVICSITAFAETDVLIQYNGSNNFVLEGGINSFNGVKAASEEETMQLEVTLINKNYIQVFGKGATISSEDIDALRQNSFWFSDKLEDTTYNQMYYKIFVYKPSLNDLLAATQNGEQVKKYTISEIEYSTVILAYNFWEHKEKAGKIDYETGDAIPEWINAGYLLINTQADVRLLLYNNHNSRYYIVDAYKDAPTLIKLKSGAYHIISVNGVSVATLQKLRGEETLPYKNIIQISKLNTEEEPYELSLEQLVEKYNITDVTEEQKEEIGKGETSTSIVPVEKEETKIEESEADKSEFNKDIILWIMLALLILLGVLFIIVQIKKKRKEREE